MYSFNLPDVGDGISEGTLVKWRVKVGDAIKEDDIVAEVETDKAVVEISSPVSGTISELPHKEGDVIEVESLLMYIDDGSGDAPAQTEKKEEKEEPKQEVKQAPKTTSSQSGEILALPKVRHAAREKGIDLSAISGSGPDGRILMEDLEGGSSASQDISVDTSDIIAPPSVRRYARENGIDLSQVQGRASMQNLDGSSPQVQKRAKPQERETIIKMSATRKTIATKMTEAMQIAPQVSLSDEVEVTELVALRKKKKEEHPEVKITYLPFIVKACVQALMEYPLVNAELKDDSIIQKNYYNIGIAAGTENGLLVPNVKDADELSLVDLAGKIVDLTGRARERKLKPEEMKQGTFTITSIGSIGGKMFTPILNVPEVGILGIGRIIKKPVVKNGGIQVGDMMFISLTFDHRVVDGDLAARFITKVKELLENPSVLVD